jgi:hypothetical protein
MAGERKRLHHRMVEEGDAVFGLDNLCACRAEGGFDIAFAALIVRLTARLAQLVLRSVDRRGRHRAVSAVGKFGAERGKALGRGPVTLGHHDHRVIELYDLLDTLDRQRGGIVDRFQLPAAHRRRRDGGNAHIGQGKVDPP